VKPISNSTVCMGSELLWTNEGLTVVAESFFRTLALTKGGFRVS
jgi:hypothetical protein